MAFNNRDEALDDLFDHLFGDDEVTDEDRSWFDDKVVTWFDKMEGVKPPGRRRKGEPSKISGRRPGSGGDQKGRRRDSDKGGYGLSLFYADKGETG
jgi:hypothetical protein